MIELLKLLSIYYLCDEVATQRQLTATEVSHCMATYEAVKLTFIEAPLATQGTPERAAQNRVGYIGFKAWEVENATTVRDLRQTARARLRFDNLF